MLILLKNGEFVRQVRPGSALNLGSVHVSPAVAGWEFEDYELVEAPPAPEPQPPTTEEIRDAMPSLSKAQLRLGLKEEGISIADVEAVLNQIEDPDEREVAFINWNDRSEYKRLHPMVLQLASIFGLSPEKVDAMWERALTL